MYFILFFQMWTSMKKWSCIKILIFAPNENLMVDGNALLRSKKHTVQVKKVLATTISKSWFAHTTSFLWCTVASFRRQRNIRTVLKNNQNKGTSKFINLTRRFLKLTNQHGARKVFAEFWISKFFHVEPACEFSQLHIVSPCRLGLWDRTPYFIKILMYTLLSLAADFAQNECTVDIGVSSRKWRSRATPTTDCKALWKINCRAFSLKAEGILLSRDLQFCSQSWQGRQRIQDKGATSREWRSRATPTTDCEAL